MLHVGEDELTCDMAETYHIYIPDWYDPPFPLSYLAKLASGLSNDSRIKRKIAKVKLTLAESLQAIMVDKLNILAWQRTKDGAKGRHIPESIYRKLMGLDDKPTDDLEKFTTEEDFEEWYRNKMR
jgi:hypothetical protein